MTDHLVQAPARMMVVLEDLEMLSQLSNARAENRDLDLGGSGVTFVPLKLIDNLCFFLFPKSS